MTAAEEQLVAELAEALGRYWENGTPDWAVAAILPVVLADRRRAVAEALDDFAGLIDRGPTFPMPPSIFSAMARERAEDARADAVEAGEDGR